VVIEALDAVELAAHARAGRRIVDVREPPMFADEHVRGSLNIALSNRSAPYWLNALTAEDEPVAIVTATRMEFGPAAELLDAAERRGLGAAAFDAAGFSAAGLALASIRTITPDALAEESTTILDVRELDEWTSGHVPGAVWIPLDELSRRLDEVPAGPVAAICASGFRSSAAVSLLEAAGRDRLANVWGGTTAWMQLGLPLRRGRQA
jgi:hydroxyacylglutathione hydrolase